MLEEDKNTKINRIRFTDSDKDILRTLGYRIAEISADDRNAVNAKNWTLLNDRKSVKPMVWIMKFPGTN